MQNKVCIHNPKSGLTCPALPCCLQWCAQTIPVCGSYQENLVGLLLPAVAQAVSAEQNGQTQNEALSSVMPQLLQVSLLLLLLLFFFFALLRCMCFM